MGSRPSMRSMITRPSSLEVGSAFTTRQWLEGLFYAFRIKWHGADELLALVGVQHDGHGGGSPEGTVAE